MLENFIFENHLGQRLVGLENGIFLNSNDLRDYAWSYDTINGRISRFYKSTKNRKIPLMVHCDSDKKAVELKNRITELAEKDIEAMLPGKIYIGEYYLCGFVTESKKTDYNLKKNLCGIELTFTSEDDSWYLMKKHTFVTNSDEVAVSGALDYPFDYSYDYSLRTNGRNIVCSDIGKSYFRLLIYGEAVNPTVIIGGHSYTVNGTVTKGQTLLVDSLAKTITLTTAYGTQINWFDKRSRENYIFEPIPAGINTVSRLGSFGFDLTVIEKRSEPKWT